MDKLEYSDLYKFIVSIGVALILAALIIPWIFLREPFDLYLTIEQFQHLSEQSKAILLRRQEYVNIGMKGLPYVTIGLFITGVASICYGLNKWVEKQKNIDKIEELNLEILELQLQKQSSNEKTSEVISDFKDATDSTIVTTTTTTKETYVENYFKLEKLFEDKLREFLIESFKIFTNYKIENFQYDFILASRLRKTSDYVFEIKYFPNGYNKGQLEEATLKLENSTLRYMKEVKRRAEPILVVVTKEEEFSKKEVEELNHFSSQNLKHFEQVKIWSVPYSEIEKLTKEEVWKLLDHKP